MNRPDSPFSRELEELKARADRLAREKANFGLLTDLMRKLSTVSGLDNVAENILRTLMNTVGGSNLTLYYRADGGVHLRDIFGRKEDLREIDDAAVREAFETGRFVQHGEGTTQEAHPTDKTKGRTLVFPLCVGSDCFGAARMEGMQVTGAEMQSQITSFMKYAALVLYNEIHNFSQLKVAMEETREANRKLIAEVAERKRSEEALEVTRRSAEEEKSKTEAILAAIGDGVSIQDRQFRVRYQNEAHKGIVGEGLGSSVTRCTRKRIAFAKGAPSRWRSGTAGSIR